MLDLAMPPMRKSRALWDWHVGACGAITGVLAQQYDDNHNCARAQKHDESPRCDCIACWIYRGRRSAFRRR